MPRQQDALTITVWSLSPTSPQINLSEEKDGIVLERGKGSSVLPREERHQQWPHRPGPAPVTSNNRIPVMSGRRKTSWILFRYVLGWSNEQPEESWGRRKRRKGDVRNVPCQRSCV